MLSKADLDNGSFFSHLQNSNEWKNNAEEKNYLSLSIYPSLCQLYLRRYMYFDKALFWLYSGQILRSRLVAVNGMLFLCELTLWWLGCSPPSWRTLAPDCPNLANTPPPYHWKQSTIINLSAETSIRGRYFSKNMEKLLLFQNNHLGVIRKNKDLFKRKRKLKTFGNLQKWVRWFFMNLSP